MSFWKATALLLLLPAVVFAQVGLNVDVEAAVRTHFAETPVMIEIARCESKFRQYSDSGDPLYGGYQGKMVGVFQVYSDIHASFARSIGMDIETLDGNLAYAKYLYEREGTKPWLSSRSCWEQATSIDTTTGPASSLTLNLSYGMEHPQVHLLQKILNARGYMIAREGPGSLGSETTTFGSLTRAAVRTFQCAEMNICDGDERSNGYGFVGPRTRTALAGASASFSGSASDDQTRIAMLQAQILELTTLLNALTAARR
jgi:hypothetical protein